MVGFNGNKGDKHAPAKTQNSTVHVYSKKALTLVIGSGYNIICCKALWRVVRVVEGARLESVCTGNCIEGSNPLLSAKSYSMHVLIIRRVFLCSIIFNKNESVVSIEYY